MCVSAKQIAKSDGHSRNDDRQTMHVRSQFVGCLVGWRRAWLACYLFAVDSIAPRQSAPTRLLCVCVCFSHKSSVARKRLWLSAHHIARIARLASSSSSWTRVAKPPIGLRTSAQSSESNAHAPVIKQLAIVAASSERTCCGERAVTSLLIIAIRNVNTVALLCCAAMML